MKKQFIKLLAVSAIFSTGLAFGKNVNAASMKLVRSSYVYTAKGKKTGAKLIKGKKINTTGTKKIKGKRYYKIGKNKYVRTINLKKPCKPDNEKYLLVPSHGIDINLKNQKVPSAKRAIADADMLPKGTKYYWKQKFNFDLDKKSYYKVGVTYPDGTKDSVDVKFTYHGTNRLVLPEGYTRENLKQADAGNINSEISTASEKGRDKNIFVSESYKEDKEKINPKNLTASQKEELSKFTLRLINQGREALGQSDWYYTDSAQKLADDVAKIYQRDNWDGTQGHYIPGLIEAAAKNGYHIDTNQIEDLFDLSGSAPKTMTEMKEDIYLGMLSFLFDGHEYHHAADIMSSHSDEEWNSEIENSPFALSYSYVNDWNAFHYIRVPNELY